MRQLRWINSGGFLPNDIWAGEEWRVNDTTGQYGGEKSGNTDTALGDDFIEFVVEHDQGYWICLSTEPNLQEPDSNLHAFRKLDCWLN